MPQAKSMVLILASLSSAGAIVLNTHRHAPGRVVGTRAGHAAMQHSKGWDDFGKPPFNFYKVSLSAWLVYRGCLLGRSHLSRCLPGP